MHERRFNPAQASRLDAPERLLWLPPTQIVEALGAKPGETVVDVGAGTGYFTLPFAQAVGENGKVYAVDAQEEMLDHLLHKLRNRAVLNVKLIHAEAHAIDLADACSDLVFMANVWHEFADRAVVLTESARILKSGGQVAILDWRPDVEREAGPPLEHRLSAAGALSDLQAAGFAQTTSRNIGRYSWLVQGERAR